MKNKKIYKLKFFLKFQKSKIREVEFFANTPKFSTTSLCTHSLSKKKTFLYMIGIAVLNRVVDLHLSAKSSQVKSSTAFVVAASSQHISFYLLLYVI